ncbi:MAG TPA: hypothetical protein VMH32_15405 [Burkholderiales bacterium]|nr:hypothetical protein [Burkholderiales bacterium]
MSTIAIHRLHARYRLGSGTESQRERMQRILSDVLDSGLEAAVQRSGIDASGELCLREVNAIARLDPNESDSALAAKLALAIAGAIEAGMGDASADVVRYGSRAHALIDLTVAAVAGDFTRAWAWRRLAIWSAEPTVSRPDAVRLVLRALTAESRYAAAAVAALAGDAALFDRFLRHASPPQLVALARAVLESSGCNHDVMADTGEPPPTQDATRLAESVRTLVLRSAIGRAAAASRETEWKADSPSRALAALILSETEPVLLHGPADRVRERIDAVSAELLELARARGTPAQERSRARTTLARNAREATPDAAQQHRPERESGSDRTRVAGRHVDESAHSPVPPRGGTPPSPLPPRASREPAAPGLVQPQWGARPIPDVRRRAHTRFGGLLYLVNLASRIELAERIAQEPRLAQRGPRWSLHQIALALVPVSASDPAALAFTGLMPESVPPNRDEAPPSEPEQAAIAQLRETLLQELRELLDRPLDPEAELIDFVCRRTAEIVADPGWLEVRLSLDEVRTEIRSAGLDLDPGWVPWLAIVIQFVYA